MDEREAELQEWCQALGHYEKVQDDEGGYTDDVVFVAGQDAKGQMGTIEGGMRGRTIAHCAHCHCRPPLTRLPL